MRLLRVGSAGSERPAVLTGDDVLVDVSGLIEDFTETFWLEGGLRALWQQLSDNKDLPSLDPSTVRFGPPVPRPSKLVCVGLNYEDHVRELGAEMPTEPVIFMKASNTVVGPNDDIHIPPHASKTDYEVELAVVIGDQCRYMASPEEAGKAIAGYAISNDVSERAYQLEKGGQWVKGKSFETFNPLGPCLVTSDELDDPQDLNLELRVNGSLRQKSNTSQMIFTAPYLVWYISQFMVLEPGDIVNTGTPPGVGLGMDPPVYLNPGDRLELSITGLGKQSQNCVASSP